MKGVIWHNNNYSKGLEQLERIIKNYEQINIPIAQQHFTKINTSVIFENGDTWKVIAANECSRGQRCNIAYIERNIDFNIYQTIICPTITAFPFSAIHLWGEGNLHLFTETPLPF